MSSAAVSVLDMATFIDTTTLGPLTDSGAGVTQNDTVLLALIESQRDEVVGELRRVFSSDTLPATSLPPLVRRVIYLRTVWASYTRRGKTDSAAVNMYAEANRTMERLIARDMKLLDGATEFTPDVLLPQIAKGANQSAMQYDYTGDTRKTLNDLSSIAKKVYG